MAGAGEEIGLRSVRAFDGLAHQLSRSAFRARGADAGNASLCFAGGRRCFFRRSLSGGFWRSFRCMAAAKKGGDACGFVRAHLPAEFEREVEELRLFPEYFELPGDFRRDFVGFENALVQRARFNVDDSGARDGDQRNDRAVEEPLLEKADQLAQHLLGVGAHEGFEQVPLFFRLQDRRVEAFDLAFERARPVFAFFVPDLDRHRAVHALRFDDEQADRRDQQMVDLEGVAFVLDAQIVDDVDVGLVAETARQPEGHVSFGFLPGADSGIGGSRELLFFDDHRDWKIAE